MSPPSLRSRKRPAGHLAVRRPIPRMHREPLPGVVCRAARAPFLYPPTVSVSTSERRVSKRWLTRDSRTGQTSDSVHHTAAFEKKKKKKSLEWTAAGQVRKNVGAEQSEKGTSLHGEHGPDRPGGESKIVPQKIVRFVFRSLVTSGKRSKTFSLS